MTEEEIKKLVDERVAAEKKALEDKNAELLAEKKKEKDRADQLAREKADAEAASLKEKGDFKSLVEKYENDLKIEREAKKAAEDRRLSEIKKGAFALELDKLGIIPERKAFILASVNVDALQYVEAGNIVLGADTKAKEIQAQMPEIFGKRNNNLPNGGNGGSGDPSYMSDEWYEKLSSKDKDKYYTEYMASKGITVKK
jgi:hypothetical protein